MNIELKSEYESLLLKREQYEKEAGVYLTLYIHEFGELITDVYKAKIDCIELKKNNSLLPKMC
jgi:S-adenosylmethionine hydrolase